MPPFALFAQQLQSANATPQKYPAWLKEARGQFYRLSALPTFDNQMMMDFAHSWLESTPKKSDQTLFCNALNRWADISTAMRASDKANPARARHLGTMMRRAEKVADHPAGRKRPSAGEARQKSALVRARTR